MPPRMLRTAGRRGHYTYTYAYALPKGIPPGMAGASESLCCGGGVRLRGRK